MKGYKIFEFGWTCRGYQYELGKTSRDDQAPVMCERGFHFCPLAIDCLEHYQLSTYNRYAEVLAVGEVVTDEVNGHVSKCATNVLTVVRELSKEEFAKLCTGRTIARYKSGSVYTDTNWLEGITHGLYARYYENGQLERTGMYKHGRPVGDWTQYDSDGLANEQYFIDHEDDDMG